MGFNFFERNGEQDFLLPPSTSDWVPEDDLVRFVMDTMGSLDLTPFRAAYREDGRGGTAFDPEMMATLLVFSYMLGQRSTREIEKMCGYDLRFRLICGDRIPDHSTISRFRKRNPAALEALFSQILALLADAGAVRASFLAIDGTKIKANASLDKNKRLEELLRQDVKRWLEECDEIDAEEDELYGEENRGDELPEAISTPAKRKKFLDEAIKRRVEEAARVEGQQKERLAERVAEEKKAGRKKTGSKPKSPAKAREEFEKKTRVNTSDPDSRMMKGSKGYVQGYNAQLAVTEDQIIIVAELTNQESDWDLLHPMVKKAEGNVARAGSREKVRQVVADAGYASDANLKKVEKSRQQFFIAIKKDRVQASELKRTEVVEGKPAKCLSAREKMGHRLRTSEGREAYRKRGQTVEPVFGRLKEGLGFERFMMRSLESCRAEWFLITTAHNFLKLAKYAPATGFG